MAGSERRSYPAETSIVMLPCTGRIDESLMLKAFENGADGVMVIGCLEGDCQYLSGNLRAKARVQRVAETLERIGLGAGRLRMYNLSAGEGAKFAGFTSEFFDQMMELGPSPINLVRKNEEGAAMQEVRQ